MNDEQTAINILRSGGILIYPTDTAFGIGCRVDRPRTVDRLFALRKRPVSQATPVLVSSEEMALLYFLDPTSVVRRLMKRYWPGALTIVAPCHTEKIHAPVRGGTENVGLRMPNHEPLLRIIAEVGVPILGPSANFHGEKTPYRTDDLNPELIKYADFVLPGSCTLGSVSTVVDCSVSPYTILRQGVLKIPGETDLPE